MKAIYFDGVPRMRRNYPDPFPRKGEVLIKVRLAGICRTDLEIFKGYMGFRGVPGHEFVGDVVGPRSSRFFGRRVVGEINCGCGRCACCRRGDPRHCPKRTVLGIAGRDGAFGEYLVLPEKCLHLVPETVSEREAVFTEPLAAACRILDQVSRLPARTLVIGDGKLGLLVAQVLTRKTKVTLWGHHATRARMVCGKTIEISTPSRLGTRYPLVVEASGSPTGLEAAVGAVAPEGAIILKSTYAGSPTFDFSRGVVVPEVTVLGSRCGPFEMALELLRKKQINTQTLIDGEYRLEDWREAFTAARRPGALKVLLKTP